MADLHDLIHFTSEEERYFTELSVERDRTLSPFAAKNADAVYPFSVSSGYRSSFSRDIDTVLNNVFYSRFSDKTQVHSFYRNDDLTRRALHVQIVSRIARSIGGCLQLNLDLIEAIAIGHDIGHTPFGHRGERYLSELYQTYGGKFFNHNVHSVRVLTEISARAGSALSLQVLDGILSHNGEFLLGTLRPSDLRTFAAFETKYKSCYTDEESIKKHIPNTLEGCVVRISDIIAYIGKDRLDLANIKRHDLFHRLPDRGLGIKNSDIIKNVTTNLLKNSIGKPYIKLDAEVAAALNLMKSDNYEIIYHSKDLTDKYETVANMFERLFVLSLEDVTNGTDRSYIHRNFLDANYLKSYRAEVDAGRYSPADTAVDYLACMTDDYFIDLCGKLDFPEKIKYIGYFDQD